MKDLIKITLVQLISKLIKKGLRVAISSNGHKAINNILLKVENFCKLNSIKGNFYKILKLLLKILILFLLRKLAY